MTGNQEKASAPVHLPPWMIASLLLLAFCGAVVAGVQRHGTAGFEALNQVQTTVLAAALAIIVSWIAWIAAVPGGSSTIPREFQPWLAVAALGVVVKMLFPLQPALLFLVETCFRRGALWSMLALAMFLVVLRRNLTPAMGATAGALAGIAGFTVCETFCPILEASHILMAHLSLGLVFAAAGMAVGPAAGRLLRMLRG